MDIVVTHDMDCQHFFSCFIKLFSVWSVPVSSLSRVSLAGLPVNEGQEDKEEGRDTEDCVEVVHRSFVLLQRYRRMDWEKVRPVRP